eukprot:gene9321-6678_t
MDIVPNEIYRLFPLVAAQFQFHSMWMRGSAQIKEDLDEDNGSDKLILARGVAAFYNHLQGFHQAEDMFQYQEYQAAATSMFPNCLDVFSRSNVVAFQGSMEIVVECSGCEGDAVYVELQDEKAQKVAVSCREFAFSRSITFAAPTRGNNEIDFAVSWSEGFSGMEDLEVDANDAISKLPAATSTVICENGHVKPGPGVHTIFALFASSNVAKQEGLHYVLRFLRQHKGDVQVDVVVDLE